MTWTFGGVAGVDHRDYLVRPEELHSTDGMQCVLGEA